jgi:hypothetical protein
MDHRAYFRTFFEKCPYKQYYLDELDDTTLGLYYDFLKTKPIERHEKLFVRFNICSLCKKEIWIGFEVRGFGVDFITFPGTGGLYYPYGINDGNRGMSYECEGCKSICGCRDQPVINSEKARMCKVCDQQCCWTHEFLTNNDVCQACLDLVKWGKAVKNLIQKDPIPLWEDFVKTLRS